LINLKEGSRANQKIFNKNALPKFETAFWETQIPKEETQVNDSYYCLSLYKCHDIWWLFIGYPKIIREIT
jgi:hypothetical protein